MITQKPTILELRRLMNKTNDPRVDVPCWSPEDWVNKCRPALEEWLAEYGWSGDEYFNALDVSLRQDGMWNEDKQDFVRD